MVQDAGEHRLLKINIVVLIHQVTFGVYVIANAILDNVTSKSHTMTFKFSKLPNFFCMFFSSDE